jgi:hypothetical protein
VYIDPWPLVLVTPKGHDDSNYDAVFDNVKYIVPRGQLGYMVTTHPRNRGELVSLFSAQRNRGRRSRRRHGCVVDIREGVRSPDSGTSKSSTRIRTPKNRQLMSTGLERGRR